ncbi:MAG TPA: NADH-quinone oxidoreductase subunit L [Steroidobacteraceae bacterium]|nr:NADH-quinone oxidoreductase subunit L [Steroidobacteraceae bacterium]
MGLNPTLLLWIPLLPLLAAIVAGLGGRWIPRAGAAGVTIAGVALSCVLSLVVLKQVAFDGAPVFNESVYTWLVSDGIRMEIGFLVDPLTAMMMAVVTFVSLCVHIYTIGYMQDDPGFKRFFSYISLFTFAMLMLVMANNFLQLFFGWEAVGLVSYLLIGFWYTRPTAIFANMKAFLVNRVGDFGFLLGIAGVVYFTGSLQYTDAFAAVERIAGQNFFILGGEGWNALTMICICLFIGAMGKSAQVPLHVWLPDSMEGPTPISALIHAATMVTAGIFMVARMSPLFEGSEAALQFILVIGATTALFMGLLGIVQNDIKRVVAYSTLSQLGYMTVALGASAYSAGVFHLMTHAFFKALLFLAAGSVIIGMHHDQDIRNMGGLSKYMRITWITSLIGSLALIGTPFLSGFYSKDSIILAVEHSGLGWASGYATFAVLAGVFITAFYSFRMYFLVFHGPERFRNKPFPGEHDAHAAGHGAHDAAHDAHGDVAHGHGAQGHADGHAHGGEPHESPAVVWIPLVLLAIPSLVIGGLTIAPMLGGDFFGGSIFIAHEHEAMHHVAEHAAHPGAMGWGGFLTLPFWLAAAGVAAAWFLYLRRPDLPGVIAAKLAPLVTLLNNKYYFDWFNENVIARLSRLLGTVLWKAGDQAVIDGALVNGSAFTVKWVAGIARRVQTGFLYTYAFWMVIGLAVLLGWYLVAR